MVNSDTQNLNKDGIVSHKNKRFIAGAACPQCTARDTLFTYTIENQKWRACVDCNFNEAMNFTPVVRELDTRVNISEEEKTAQIQVVRVLGEEK
jgi:uncharacterized protein